MLGIIDRTNVAEMLSLLVSIRRAWVSIPKVPLGL